MSRFSHYISVFLVLFEIVLVYYYFVYLVPIHNNREYIEFPTVSKDSTPTCNLFITQNEAQIYFDKNKATLPKLFQLDRDHDGKVCEGLP